MQLTGTMITMRPTIDSILTSHVMTMLVDEIGVEFIAAQKAIEARAKHSRARKTK
jgi:hypothetical protein